MKVTALTNERIQKRMKYTIPANWRLIRTLTNLNAEIKNTFTGTTTVNRKLLSALLNSGGWGDLLWAPRSWTRASPVPHGPKASEAEGTGGARWGYRRGTLRATAGHAEGTGLARFHERGAHSGLLYPPPPESTQAYMGRSILNRGILETHCCWSRLGHVMRRGVAICENRVLGGGSRNLLFWATDFPRAMGKTSLVWIQYKQILAFEFWLNTNCRPTWWSKSFRKFPLRMTVIRQFTC